MYPQQLTKIWRDGLQIPKHGKCNSISNHSQHTTQTVMASTHTGHAAGMLDTMLQSTELACKSRAECIFVFMKNVHVCRMHQAVAQQLQATNCRSSAARGSSRQRHRQKEAGKDSTCKTSRLAEELGTNFARSSFLIASSCRNLAVLYVSLRLCTKMSTWLVPASSKHCTPYIKSKWKKAR